MCSDIRTIVRTVCDAEKGETAAECKFTKKQNIKQLFFKVITKRNAVKSVFCLSVFCPVAVCTHIRRLDTW